MFKHYFRLTIFLVFIAIIIIDAFNGYYTESNFALLTVIGLSILWYVEDIKELLLKQSKGE